jgi:hypothetical protein
MSAPHTATPSTLSTLPPSAHAFLPLGWPSSFADHLRNHQVSNSNPDPAQPADANKSENTLCNKNNILNNNDIINNDNINFDINNYNNNNINNDNDDNISYNNCNHNNNNYINKINNNNSIHNNSSASSAPPGAHHRKRARHDTFSSNPNSCGLSPACFSEPI